MWRDRWFALSVIDAALVCVACLTPVAVLVLGAIGLGAWTGRVDMILLPLLGGFVVLALYRDRSMRRRTPRDWARSEQAWPHGQAPFCPRSAVSCHSPSSSSASAVAPSW